MATSTSSNNFTPLLKRQYLGYVQRILFANSPLLGMLERINKGGEDWTHTISYEGAQNHGATYSKVIAGTSQSQQKRFATEAKEYFGEFILDHKIMKASEKNTDAVVRHIVHEMKTALQAYSKEISLQLYRKSNGFKGVVSSVATGGGVDVITLSERADIVNFSVNMKLIASANADGSAPKDSGVSKTVTKVNVQEGKITLSGNIGSLAANDYLFIDGNQNLLINGILDWIPDAAERSASGVGLFLGADRTVNDVMLAGSAVDGSSSSFEDALIDASIEAQFLDASPKIIMMNHLTFGKLAKELSSKEIIHKGMIKGNMSATIGYKTVEIAGVDGSILLDAACPAGRAFFLTPDAWQINHLGNDIVNEWDDDSLQILRDPSDNKLKGRYYSYHNLICREPSKNLILTLPSS